MDHVTAIRIPGGRSLAEDKREEEERIRHETERDLDTLTRMSDIQADPERLKRARDKLKKDLKIVSSISDLKARIQENEEGGSSHEDEGGSSHEDEGGSSHQ